MNAEEENEFHDRNDSLYYDDEDETIFPIPGEGHEVDSEAETVAGDFGLDDSMASSGVVTFNAKAKNNQELGTKIVNDSFVDKWVEDMTPDELLQANPALKQLMLQLLSKGKDEKGADENKEHPRTIVKDRETRNTGRAKLMGNVKRVDGKWFVW